MPPERTSTTSAAAGLAPVGAEPGSSPASTAVPPPHPASSERTRMASSLRRPEAYRRQFGDDRGPGTDTGAVPGVAGGDRTVEPWSADVLRPRQEDLRHLHGRPPWRRAAGHLVRGAGRGPARAGRRGAG